MKKLIFPLAIIFLAGIMSFTMYSSRPLTDSNDDVEIPENVKKVIDSKCWGCHNENGNSLKGKTKLKFDQLSTLSKAKLISKLDDIAEELEEGKMPPSGFLKKNPDKKLSEEEAKVIIEWAHNASDNLMK